MTNTVESFLPKLEQMARIYAHSTLESLWDVYQEMILAILEKAHEDTEFLNQTSSYILHAGRLKAWHLIKKRQTFDRFQEFKSDDPGQINWHESIPYDGETPEESLIRKQGLEGILNSITRLSGRTGQVVSLVIAGMGTGEIAGRLGITPAAVCCYKKRAAQKIRTAILGD